MFDIITKSEYWSWLDAGIIASNGSDLKHIQDAFILSRLNGCRGKRILELGGGQSRILHKLKRDNECWNVDRFEGQGNGPRAVQEIDGVNTVVAFMGDFDRRIPSDYFDYVISVSVVEHIPPDAIENVFLDCARVLKPGGEVYHAIDLYLFDTPAGSSGLISRYRKEYLGLYFIEPPAIDETVSFKCHYASNPDSELYRWNKVAPHMNAVRIRAQSASIKAGWRKVVEIDA